MTVAEGMERVTTAFVTYRQGSMQQLLPVLFLRTAKAKVGVSAWTPQKTGFIINFAYLETQLEFQQDSILLFIYNPQTSLHDIRTAAAFQQATDVYSLHVTFYHIAHT